MEWTRTRSVVADLTKFLTCGICEGYLKDPCTLDNCDHNFCRKCIEESLGHDSKCPECGSFSWMKDLRVNNQLTMTVNMTLKLQSLIGENTKVKDNAVQEKPKPLALNTFPSPPCEQQLEKSSDHESVSIAKPMVTQCGIADGVNMTESIPKLQENNSLENRTNIMEEKRTENINLKGLNKATKKQNKMIQQQSAVVKRVMEFEYEANHTGTTTVTTEKTRFGKKTKAGQTATIKGNKQVRKNSKATVKGVSTDEESENESSHSARKHKTTKKPISLSLRGRKVKESERVEKNVRIRNSTIVKQASSTVESDATDEESDSKRSNPRTVELVRESSNARENGKISRGTANTDTESDTSHTGDAKTRKENTNMEQNLKQSPSHTEQENVTILSSVPSGSTDAEFDSDANSVSIIESIKGKKDLRRHSEEKKPSAVEERGKITNEQSITKPSGNNTESDSERNHSTTVPNSKGVKIHPRVRKIAKQRKSTENASEADTESDIEANKARANLNENSTKSASNTLKRPYKVAKKWPVQRDSAMSGSETDEETTKEEANVKQRRQVRNLRRRKMTDTQPTATAINTATDLQSDSETNHASTSETVSQRHTNAKRLNVRKSATAQVYKKTVKRTSITELSTARPMESVDVKTTSMKERIETEITSRKEEATETPQATNLGRTIGAEEMGNINGDVKKSNHATKNITVENTNRARPSGQERKCSKRAVSKKDDSISEKAGRKVSEKNVLKTYLFRDKLNPNSKVKSNLTEDRFDFTQEEDPFHFSFTDAEGNDSNDDDDNGIDIDYDDAHNDQKNDHGSDDCNNDYDKLSLRSMHKASRNKISKDRRAEREISNPFELGQDDVEHSNAVLQKTKSKGTSQRTIGKVQFTHLKDRCTNRGQPEQNTIEKDKKKTSSNELSRPDPLLKAVEDEYKENNDTLNVRRRRVRSKNSNIRQYFIPVNNKDTNEDFSNNGVPVIPPKRRKLTSSSEIPRNLITSSQCSQNASALSQGGRNKKGETPLHLAAIKGDIASALELINEGADPNVKDYAGWTPLHEACNHGHVDIVELLLDHNALINIPGHDNDTPLHDAVANGRLKVAKLLVSRGAVLTARNKQGLLPMHYAVTKAMKAALASSKANPINDIENVKKYTVICRESQVILGSALKTQDKVKLKKCIKQLGGTLVDEFDESVTHIVTSVNENGHCPRTIKNLFGILTGKWIVSFEWINGCLRQREWLNEDVYEVEGTVGKTCNGAKKARLNNLQQMPRLFDGCSFFLRGVFNSPTPSRQDIIKLITVGGGELLHREPKVRDDDLTSLPSSPIVTSLSRQPKVAYHAPANSSLSCCTEFILYDSTSCDQPKIVYSPVLRTAPVTWLMDCISSFQLLDIPDA